MKFQLASVLLSLFSAGSTFAAILISLKAGDRLSVSKPFNLDYDSERYFKEQSNTISVVISSDKTGLSGGLVLQDQTPTNHSGIYDSATYSVKAFPFFLYGVNGPGIHTVHVLESYQPYGAPNALQITSVPVTFF
ncbi:hypothetical protein C8F04DRAFT_639632 [Mycena alexandri]|uniref:Uncharacterized protein n=1 Tax=Mycena alexandri TaxID=1745969 RepID=A0AAD6X246_9AGAR|nr:hypothetical protein C8F04DRAFT_639632 [Mycena alexandri]